MLIYILINGQHDAKLREHTFFRFHGHLSSMRLYDIVADRQAQTRTLTCRFGGKKRLEYFIDNFFRNADDIVPDPDLDFFEYSP